MESGDFESVYSKCGGSQCIYAQSFCFECEHCQDGARVVWVERVFGWSNVCSGFVLLVCCVCCVGIMGGFGLCPAGKCVILVS